MNRTEVSAEIERSGRGKVPLWCHWYAKETEKKYGSALEEIKRKFPDDILVVDFLSGRQEFDDHPYWFGGRDEFGCVWEISPEGVGGHVKDHILKDWDTLDEYLGSGFPDPAKDTVDRFSKARDARRRWPDKYIAGRSFRLFWERMYFLRGMDSMFIDLYTNRENINRLAERLTDFILKLIEGWKEVGVDAVFIADDWGLQDRLMIKPQMWREIFKPWYVRIFKAIHDRGMHVWFHSCGNITDIVGDLIDCGVDVLNPIQPTAIDLNALSKRYRGKVTFSGGIDAQIGLTRFSPEEVKKEVKDYTALLKTQSGGYIGGPSTTIMPETPLVNIMAMCEAFRENNRSSS